MSNSDLSRREHLQSLALGVTGAAVALGAATLTATPAAAAPQPYMEAALHSLEEALHNLEAAIHNKGGHRLKAIGLVRSAIEETRRGIAVGDI